MNPLKAARNSLENIVLACAATSRLVKNSHPEAVLLLKPVIKEARRGLRASKPRLVKKRRA